MTSANLHITALDGVLKHLTLFFYEHARDYKNEICLYKK